jgi:hypothetical protein
MVNLRIDLMRRPFSVGPEDQLSASKNADPFTRFLMNHFRVPNLGATSGVNAFRATQHGSISRRSEVIRLCFYCREALRAGRQVGQTSIASSGVGHGDDSSGVQVAVRRHQAASNRKKRVNLHLSDIGNHKAKKSRKVVSAELVEVRLIEHGSHPNISDRSRGFTQTKTSKQSDKL